MDFKKIIKEEIDDFDFIRKVEEDPLAVGNLIFISNVGTTHDSLLSLENRHGGDTYCLLKIVDIIDDDIHYEPIKWSKNWPLITGFPNHCTIEHANKIINSGYWRILNNVPESLMDKRRAKPEDFLPYVIYDKGSLNESDDLKWMDDIPSLDLRSGYIIDVHNSMTPVRDILKGLHDEGYVWTGGFKICDENGDVIDIWTEYNRKLDVDVRYIGIGPIESNGDYGSLHNGEIMYIQIPERTYGFGRNSNIYTV